MAQPDPARNQHLIDAAQQALKHGWHPIPVATDKTPAMVGVTGRSGRDLTADELEDAFTIPGAVAIGLRMPEGVIGIDVDQYDDKEGFTNLKAFMLQHGLGRLPDTWTSSSRARPSGIRFYLVPASIRFQGAPVPGVEIIQRHHRHAMTAPSRHPKTGEQYQWVSPEGELSLEPPYCEQGVIADLPAEWVTVLTDTRPQDTTLDTPAAWNNPNANTPAMSHELAGLIDWLKNTPAGGRHDRTLQALGALWRYDQQQHPGTNLALQTIRTWFMDTIGKDRPQAAQREWDDLNSSARTYIANHYPRPTYQPDTTTEPDTTPTWAAPNTNQQPFTPEPAPDFPLDTLPDLIATYTEEISYTLQTPVDIAVACTLGALATILTPHIVIQYDDTWSEHTNLYLAVGIPPSGGKSPVYKAVFAPINELERTLADQAREQRQRNDAARKAAARDLKRVEDQGTPEQIFQAINNLEAIPNTVIPRLRCDDQTPEAFTQLLADHPHITISSTEGGLFNNMSRYTENQQAQLDPYLKAWSGDPIIVDRKKAEPIHIPRALASICITVQPAVLRDLGQSRDFHQRGLPQRFMYAIPTTNIGHRDRLTRRPANHEIRQAWNDLIIQEGLRWHSNQHPKTIRFTPDAWNHMAQWQQNIEHRRLDDLEPLADWAAKAESSVIRIAGILWAAEGGNGNTIDLDLAQRATRIGDYWIGHAKHFQDLTRTNETTENARDAWRVIHKKQLAEITPRDLQRHNIRRYDTVDTARAALELLAADGWLLVTSHGSYVPNRTE